MILQPGPNKVGASPQNSLARFKSGLGGKSESTYCSLGPLCQKSLYSTSCKESLPFD